MKNVIITMSLLIICLNANSQSSEMVQGDKQYAKLAYKSAIKSYEKAASDGVKSLDLYQKLGNCYYFNGQFKEANKWYSGLFTLDRKIEAEYYFRYSQTLKTIGDYDKANEYLEHFNRLAPEDLRSIKFRKNRNYLELIKKNSGRYDVGQTGVNSEFSDYGASFYEGKLIFASSRFSGGLINKKSEWDDQSFSNLYQASVNDDGSLGEVEKFSKDIATKVHESTPVFTADGKTMYFTRNNYINGKLGKDDKRTTLLKIYKATLEGDSWVNITELPFNSDEYNTAHPTLSADERTLYFSSNRPGGFGDSDLYKVNIISDSFYGTPENLGSDINTEARETFPFITTKNELYFASDGHLGLGGLDIFVAKINEEGKFSQAYNVGSPVNGPNDDFSYYINSLTRMGYFSSNREGGKGFDDIYRFLENRPLDFLCDQKISGIVYDQATNEIMVNATVTLYDSESKEIGKVDTDKEGKYTYKIECNKKYKLIATEDEYDPSIVEVASQNRSGDRTYDLYLKKPVKVVEKVIEIGENLEKTYNLDIIRFDLSKWNIRPDAAIELNKIVKVMKDYPTIKVDVRSHTDSRASAKFNKELSEKRAKSTIAYLISEGIDASRLTGRGYGESVLLNGCKDNVECTESEHQLNRRSEFIVVSK